MQNLMGNTIPVHVVIEDIRGKKSRIVGVYNDSTTASSIRDYMTACAVKTPDYTYRAESYLVAAK